MSSQRVKQERAFELYFRMGDERSIEKLHERLEAEGDAPSLRTLYGWSSQYGWQNQIAEVELTALASVRDARLEEARQMDLRHVTVARLLHRRGTEALENMDPTLMTPAQAIRAIEVGMRLEWEAFGPRPKIDITERIREMASSEDLDPDKAVEDALKIIESSEDHG